MLRHLVEAVLLPPLNCLLLAAVGVAVRRRWRRLGTGLIVSAAVLLWLLSTPWVATSMLRALQTEAPLDLSSAGPPAGAIVVLSADMDRLAPELGGPSVGPLGLQRMRYGIALHRATGVPLLVTGGVPAPGLPPHAATMVAELERQGLAARWVESRSADTHENAVFSARLLSRDGVTRVYLVTHAWHMPRARRAFEAAGLQVTPAPTGFRAPVDAVLPGLVPSWSALRDSSLALHECLGMVWYELVHYRGS